MIKHTFNKNGIQMIYQIPLSMLIWCLVNYRFEMIQSDIQSTSFGLSFLTEIFPPVYNISSNIKRLIIDLSGQHVSQLMLMWSSTWFRARILLWILDEILVPFEWRNAYGTRGIPRIPKTWLASKPFDFVSFIRLHLHHLPLLPPPQPSHPLHHHHHHLFLLLLLLLRLYLPCFILCLRMFQKDWSHQ